MERRKLVHIENYANEDDCDGGDDVAMTMPMAMTMTMAIINIMRNA